MYKKENLISILRDGILEIRILSAREEVDRRRINIMSNILHNIPTALNDDKDFDYDFLNKEIENYKDVYTDSLFNAKENK